MSMISCPECGKSISEKAFYCPSCGYPLNENAASTSVLIKKKMPGKGLGIAGMVMGILGVVYSPLTLISTSGINISTDATFAPGCIVMAIYIAVFGILALAFGFASRAKRYKKGQSMSAIIMGFITLAFCVATIIISALALY